MPNVTYGGGTISLGDTVLEKGISFVKWRNLWVAGEVICLNAGWNDLFKHTLITGWPVRIDGTAYVCRSLRVGEESGEPNEWDSILDELEEDDTLWHWKEHFFWGQETPKGQVSTRAIRGRFSAHNWSLSNATTRSVSVGFRPVLGSLPPEPLISDSLIGTILKLYGTGKGFSGRLAEFSDYDLVIETATQQLIPADCKWASRDGDRLIVDRSAITWIQEVG